MKRRCFERTKRTAPRLMVEILESRRVMAGLNVLVFQDQDGSRSQSALELPAANRLVYVDLNRDGQFADGEPLAVTNGDGIASFANLPAGEYRIALAGKHAAQLQTTSVSSAPVATVLASYASQNLLANRNLTHAWAISSTGQVRGVGSSDPDNFALDLGGPVISISQVVGDQAWALIDQGQAQPTLLRLDLSAGTRQTVSVSGMLAGRKLASVAWLGDSIVLQQQGADGSWLSRTKLAENRVLLEDAFAVPTGRAIDSGDASRIAVLDPSVAGGLSVVTFRGSVAEIASVPGTRLWRDALLSPDGKWLFAAANAGGVEVFATDSGLKSVALLAEATGPLAFSPRDGRLTTANTTVSDQLIVWDTTLWQPVSRTVLPSSTGIAGQASRSLAVAVDEWGNRLLAATPERLFSADLALPSAAVVKVPLSQSAKASLGVRVTTAVASLPSAIAMAQSVVEDVPLELNLRELAALAGLSTSSLVFLPGELPQLGTLQVTPSGRFAYKPATDQNGSDTATIQVYDGVSTSTLVVSLDIEPVNDPPTAFNLQAIAIAEAAAQGTLAGTASVLDVDSNARYLMTTSDERFVVVDGQLLRSASGSLDYETEPIVELDITATDMDDWSISWTRHLQIPVLDSNDGPISVSVMPVPVKENSAGSLVGHVVVVDPDGYDRYVFSVSDDRFEVVGDQLRLKSGIALDRESESLVYLSVLVYDVGAQIAREASVTASIEILDANDPPEAIVLDSAKVPRDKAGAVVGVVDVIDQDILDTYSFVISDPRFEIDGNVLRLKADQKLVATDVASIPILVTAQDRDGVMITQSFTVNVVNDAPGQNPVNPMDVDNDGHVSPRDVLLLINVLNDKGPHAIEPVSTVGEGDGVGASVFIDVNGDGMLTALDALLLINQLNSPAGSQANPEGEAEPLVFSEMDPPRALLGQPESDVLESWQVTEESHWACSAADGLSLLTPQETPADISVLGDSPLINAEIESLLESLSRERSR